MATLARTIRLASYPPTLSRAILSPLASSPSFSSSSSSPPSLSFSSTSTRSSYLSLHVLTSRRLSTTSIRPRAPPPTSKPSSPPPSSPSPPRSTTSSKATTTTTAATSPAAAPSRYAFIKSLASKPSPTILYEAPSHFWFYLGCWSSGLSILSWTLLTAPSVISQPEGVPSWVGIVFGASYAILGSMGFYIIAKTPGIVSSIRLLPAASPSATPSPAASIPRAATGHVSQTAAAAASSSSSSSSSRPSSRPSVAASRPPASPAPAAPPATARIEITVKRMLPLLPPKTITASLDKVSLKTRLSLPAEFVPDLKRQAAAQAAAAAAKSLRDFDLQHLLTMPFRRMGRAVVGFFRGVRAAWTGMGYGVIRVDGKEYKVDVMGGYAHDGFLTLERIVGVGK